MPTFPNVPRVSAVTGGLVVLFFVFSALQLDAQSLDGQVADGESYAVLEGAAITLMHPDGHDLSEPVLTSASGRFSIAVPGPGAYYVRAELDGYTGIVEGVFEFQSATSRLSVEVFLRRAPVEIEGVDVSVERENVRRSLRAQGFYERLSRGFGDFVTPEEIEERGVIGDPSELMRGIPGISTFESLVLFRASGGPRPIDAVQRCSPGQAPTGPPTSDPLIMCRGDGTIEELGLCEPDVWLDGIQMTKVNARGFIQRTDLERGLDSYLTASDVMAMEVYRSISGTPLRWSLLGNTCGTIVIWTWQGR